MTWLSIFAWMFDAFLAGVALGAWLMRWKLRRMIREAVNVNIPPGESVDLFITIKDGKPEEVVMQSSKVQ